MGIAGAQQSKSGWAWRLVVLVLCGTLILILGQPLVRKWQNRESARASKSIKWIQEAAQRLERIGPPPRELGPSPPYAPWVVPGYFIFSNGWAAYDLHSFHAMDGMGDLALLRLSDGRLYFSKLHYCSGITDMMQPSGPEPAPQPTDADDFLTGVGRYQQWILLSSDERLLCTVICPDADRPRQKEKSLWVLINDSNGNGPTNLFEGRYTFVGNFLAWTTRWNSNEDLAIVVFDNNRNPMTVPGNEPDLPTNYLSTLKFHRDKQTGRFAEEKP